MKSTESIGVVTKLKRLTELQIIVDMPMLTPYERTVFHVLALNVF